MSINKLEGRGGAGGGVGIGGRPGLSRPFFRATRPREVTRAERNNTRFRGRGG